MILIMHFRLIVITFLIIILFLPSASIINVGAVESTTDSVRRLRARAGSATRDTCNLKPLRAGFDGLGRGTNRRLHQ